MSDSSSGKTAARLVSPSPALTRRAVVAGAAATAGGLALASLPSSATTAPTAQDVRVLNFVLLLEEIEAAFYAQARAVGALRGELAQFAEIVGGHELQHRAFLRKALGPRARKRPRLAFGAAIRNERGFIKAAVALEDNSVAAYNGQAENLSPGVLIAAAKIVSVEARHAAWIRDIAGLRPAVGATDVPRTEAQAMAVLHQLGFLRT